MTQNQFNPPQMNQQPQYPNNQMPQYPPQRPKGSNKKFGMYLGIVMGILVIIAVISGIVVSSGSKDEEEVAETPMSKEEWTQELMATLASDSENMDSIAKHYKTDTDPALLAGDVLVLQDIADKVIIDSLYMDVYETPEVMEIMDANSIRASKLLPDVKKRRREIFAKNLADRLWEQEIDVVTSNNNTVITFIGVYFAARKNIKEWQKDMGPELEELGYKQVRYKWSKYDDEYTYYDFDDK